jgi:uncharacterized protein
MLEGRESLIPDGLWHNACMNASHISHGIELFNREEFFDAHEVLEDIWRAAPADEKKFLQGIIQVAVALHHFRNGNSIGACSILRRAARNLSRYPEGFGGIELTALLHSIAAWQRAMDDNVPVPPFPKILLVERKTGA